ncbi:MAG: hypothetical protein MPJ78_13225 [Hyphomicrobiaceae bacterium]|nr:hypothetical protein [Hyphomicrobiaceae bacterium]
MRMFQPGWVVPTISLLTITWSLAVPIDHADASPASLTPETPAIAPPMPQANPVRKFAQLRAQLGYGDRVVAMRALHLALSQVPDGGAFVWRKRSRSLKGVIKPSKPFRNDGGQICRHVIYALALGRFVKQIEGIACRQDDGRWQL